MGKQSQMRKQRRNGGGFTKQELAALPPNAKPEHGIIKTDRTVFTRREVETILERALARTLAMAHTGSSLESALMRIYTTVEAGVEANSDTLITKLLPGVAGKFAKYVLDFQESTRQTSNNEEFYQQMYELIDAVKQAVEGKCAALITFVGNNSAEMLQDKIRNRRPRRTRQRDPMTLRIGETMHKLVTEERLTNFEAAEATRQALGLTVDHLKNTTAEQYMYDWREENPSR